MLCLRHDFYNTIFKIKQIIYSLRVSPPPSKMKNSGSAPESKAFHYWYVFKKCSQIIKPNPTVQAISTSLCQHTNPVSFYKISNDVSQPTFPCCLQFNVLMRTGEAGKNLRGRSLWRNYSATFHWTLYQNTMNTTRGQHRHCNGPTWQELNHIRNCRCAESVNMNWSSDWPAGGGNDLEASCYFHRLYRLLTFCGEDTLVQ
jgi:hypothetical protein